MQNRERTRGRSTITKHAACRQLGRVRRIGAARAGATIVAPVTRAPRICVRRAPPPRDYGSMQRC